MKSSYTLSKTNQLAITRNKTRLTPRGIFLIDKKNQLNFEAREALSWRKRYGISKRLTFKGKWRMDKDHNLIYSLKRTKIQGGGEKLILKTEIIEVKANAFVFSLGTKGKAGTHKPRLLELRGRWHADKDNRLQFLIKRAKNRTDPLTLQGLWWVENNTLIYTYRKISLATGTRHRHRLRFKGHWEINGRNRLTYILDAANDSLFDFRVYLETPNLIGKRGEIKYRVGVGAKRGALSQGKTFSLYGVWKMHRRSGLSLAVDYGEGRIKEIRFGAFVRTRKRNKVTLGLRSRNGRGLGISLELSHSFFKNHASSFLHILKDKNRRLAWGVTLPW